MLPKDTGQPKYSILYALYAVIRLLWIAAFFNSTRFEVFLHALIWCVPIVIWVRFFVSCGNITPHCRSPPSDFDFASYQLKNRNWRTP